MVIDGFYRCFLLMMIKGENIHLLLITGVFVNDDALLIVVFVDDD
jgi:hypothetical protein